VNDNQWRQVVQRSRYLYLTQGEVHVRGQFLLSSGSSLSVKGTLLEKLENSTEVIGYLTAAYNPHHKFQDCKILETTSSQPSNLSSKIMNSFSKPQPQNQQDWSSRKANWRHDKRHKKGGASSKTKVKLKSFNVPSKSRKSIADVHA